MDMFGLSGAQGARESDLQMDYTVTALTNLSYNNKNLSGVSFVLLRVMLVGWL